jgi:ABC-2 type transport system permease protein
MNLRKLFTLIYKDFLVLLNDKAGLGYMFLMPVALVFIMVTIQDSSFKAISNFDIKIIIQNKDNDSLGNMVVRGLKQSGYFNVTEAKNSEKTEKVEEMVAKGQFKIGIIIPDSSTYKLKRQIIKNVHHAFSSKKQPNKDKPKDSAHIEVFFDPVTRTSYKQMIMSMLEVHNQNVKTQLMMTQINRRIPFKKSEIIVDDIVTYKERYASVEGARIIPNSVQHNIPAWTLFALFFIVMSLGGNMIREREEGSFVRLGFAPFPFHFYLFSKLLTYLVVGLIQFLLMILMGIYVLPFFDFPALVISNKFFSLFVVAFFSSLAAVGYGILVGTFAKTYQQSSTFGSISVVIFAAIGGVWVPVFAMPEFMRDISIVSPLNWGVNAFNNVLVRDLSFTDCGNEILLLSSFFVACMLVSIRFFNTKTGT